MGLCAILNRKHIVRLLLTSGVQSYIAARVTALENSPRITACRQTSPGKNNRFPLIYPPKFTVCASGSIGLCFVLQARPAQFSLKFGSCTLDRGFASGFLQIPPRGGHPCPWLVVPTAKPTAVLHRLAAIHAGHT